jgi:hypothetical protein
MHVHLTIRLIVGPLAVAALFAVAVLASGAPQRAISITVAGGPPPPNGAPAGRVFSTSFESISDFNGFYIAPQNHLGTASHDLTTEQVRSGIYAHKGWIYGANPQPPPGGNTNHRGYPTVQLQKTPGGGYVCPCIVTLNVWLDMPLDVPGEWFSFATLTPDPSDAWSRTVLVNLSAANPAPGTAPGGVVHLMHVPNQGERQPTLQTSTILFPMRQWVEIRIYVDFDPVNGQAMVWQDGQMVSAAPVSGGNGKLEQAHFGLYAAPGLASGVIYNDDLEIVEAADLDLDSDGVANAADNCPAVANAAQASTDRNFIDQTPPSTQDDKTWPNSDAQGDACDTDDDNDGLTDGDEATGGACTGTVTNPLLRDTDGDRALDGAECALGTNPNDDASKPSAAACGLGTDTDGDRVSDRAEVCGYNTSPANTDTDGDRTLDGARDGCEAASLNNDRAVNSGDQLLLVLEIIREPSPSLRLVSMDVNKDGGVNSGDQLLVAQFLSPTGQCP